MASRVGQTSCSLLSRSTGTSFDRQTGLFRQPLVFLWLCGWLFLAGCDGANFLTEEIAGENLCEKAVFKIRECCSPDLDYSLNPAFSMVCEQYTEENAEALVAACRKSGFRIADASAVLIKNTGDCNDILLQVEHDLRSEVDGDEDAEELETDGIDVDDVPGEEDLDESDGDSDPDNDLDTDIEDADMDSDPADGDEIEGTDTEDIDPEPDEEEEIVTECTEEGQPCNDGNPCTLRDRCDENLVCTGTPDEFAACNDGNPCTLGDRCNVVGKCVGSAKSCADLGPAPVCHLAAACDIADGVCKFNVAPNGQSCNDGKFCTTEDSCDDGVCLGHGPPPCDAPGDEECIIYGCDEENDLCQWNKDDGTPCTTSGNLCYSGAICESGECVPDLDTAVVCADDNICTRDECSSSEGCVFPAIPGKVCNDGLTCTINDRCDTQGECVAEAYDCSIPFGEPGQCRMWECREPDSTGGDGDDEGEIAEGSGAEGEPVCASIADPALENQSCNDQSVCTNNDLCTQGECVGTELPCGNDENTCVEWSCDPVTGCNFEQLPENTPCDDDLPCTENDRCSANGECVGQARDCSIAGDFCNRGTCIDDGGQWRCVAKAIAAQLGKSCDEAAMYGEDIFCTINEKCTLPANSEKAVCTGAIQSCTDAFVYNPTCSTPYCDQVLDACVLDVRDDYCDVQGSCYMTGTLSPDSPDCGICDPDRSQTAFSPVLNEQNEPYMEGEDCDTDNRCWQVMPQCSGAVCSGGVTETCQDEKDERPCLVWICDPNSGCRQPSGEQTTQPNGTSCNTDSCQLEQSCQDGLCQGGTPKLCPTSLPCYKGLCNARGEDDELARPDLAEGTCYTQPLPDGSSCNDKKHCSIDDTCLVVSEHCDDPDVPEGFCTSFCSENPALCAGEMACLGYTDPGPCADEFGCTSNSCSEGVSGPICDTTVDLGWCLIEEEEGVFSCIEDGTPQPDANGDPIEPEVACSMCVHNGSPEDDAYGWSPVREGEACDDYICVTVDETLICTGNCTKNDTCVQGTCVGELLTCPNPSPCWEESCYEGTGLCDSRTDEPKPQGAPCVGSNLCRYYECATEGGSCVQTGEDVDCSDYGDMCHVGVCDPSIGCTTENVVDGTHCRDENDPENLTVNEQCQVGTCVGDELPLDFPDGQITTFRLTEYTTCAEHVGGVFLFLSYRYGQEGIDGDSDAEDDGEAPGAIAGVSLIGPDGFVLDLTPDSANPPPYTIDLVEADIQDFADAGEPADGDWLLQFDTRGRSYGGGVLNTFLLVPSCP